jgi:predicted enzyme related to lactoylglutathione lyase
MPGAPSFWLSYVLVDDIAAATAKTKSLGATIIQDQMEVPEAGTLTIFTDPTGATLGLWQPKTK